MRRRVKVLSACVIILAAVVIGWWIVRSQARAAVLRAPPETLLANSHLAGPTRLAGRQVYARACASCHGANGTGDPAFGIPNLTDNDFLYGSGRVDEIEQIALYGIRSGASKGWDLAWMPAYGQPVPYARERLSPLTPNQITEVVAFLRGLNGDHENTTIASRGHAVYMGSGGCYDCHGNDAAGDSAIGAPNLVDGIWLYGQGSAADLRHTLTWGRRGVSPAFKGRLSPYDVRTVSVYVASLHQNYRPRSHR